MKICRLCLHEGDENSILPVWRDNSEELANKIRKCVAIDIKKDDLLPTSACLKCIEHITQWEIFYENCQKSSDILNQSLIDNKNEILFKPHVSIEVNRNEEIEDDIKRLYDSDESDLDANDDFIYESDLNIKAGETLSDCYSCEICEGEFSTLWDYLDHQETHDGQPVFNCDKCSEVFICRKDLVDHDSNHRSPCHQCGKMILKSSMKLHLVKHTDKHVCLLCSGHFNSKAALGQHYITVHTDIKNHICEACGKRFSSQTAMRVHMKSHSDERMYPCKLCNYAGRTASAVYVHMSTHANDLCVCEVCSKTFKSNRNLNDHLRRVHSTDKRHECTYCNKKFVDKYMLKVHLRCHTGVRPYQCGLCDKAFIRSDGLKEHMATHGDRIAYSCKECGKKFASRRSVTRHNCVAML